jgi:hypothetical protein
MASEMLDSSNVNPHLSTGARSMSSTVAIVSQHIEAQICWADSSRYSFGRRGSRIGRCTHPASDARGGLAHYARIHRTLRSIFSSFKPLRAPYASISSLDSAALGHCAVGVL